MAKCYKYFSAGRWYSSRVARAVYYRTLYYVRQTADKPLDRSDVLDPRNCSLVNNVDIPLSKVVLSILYRFLLL